MSNQTTTTRRATPYYTTTNMKTLGGFIAKRDATVSELRTYAARVDALGNRILALSNTHGLRFEYCVTQYQTSIDKLWNLLNRESWGSARMVITRPTENYNSMRPSHQMVFDAVQTDVAAMLAELELTMDTLHTVERAVHRMANQK